MVGIARGQCGRTGPNGAVPDCTPAAIAGRADLCETAQSHFAAAAILPVMSARNGDRARFHKDRKRRLRHRQRIHALVAGRRKRLDEATSSRVASVDMQAEGGPARTGD
jgi:hypothetical protein